jgi:hypothetical protein
MLLHSIDLDTGKILCSLNLVSPLKLSRDPSNFFRWKQNVFGIFVEQEN